MMNRRRSNPSTAALTARHYREKKKWEAEFLQVQNEQYQRDIQSLKDQLTNSLLENSTLSSQFKCLASELNSLR